MNLAEGLRPFPVAPRDGERYKHLHIGTERNFSHSKFPEFVSRWFQRFFNLSTLLGDLIQVIVHMD